MLLNEKKYMRGVLYACCVIFTIGITVGTFSSLSGGLGAFQGSGSSGVFRFFVLYILFGQLPILLPQVLFILFVVRIIKKGEFFSRRQSFFMFGIGILLFIRIACDLLIPYSGLFSEFSSEMDGMWGMPSINLTHLVFGVMFLALGFIFEYGRQLQEDANEII